MPPTARRRLGSQGEGYARHYLEAHGYVFVTANWHCATGELDLVMREGDEVVFVEVKTRRGEQMGSAEESLSPAQANRLLVASEWFLAETPALSAAIWRIDLVAITLDQTGAVHRLSHLINAVGVG